MKIYKISIADSMGESRGFEYRATMREAKDAAALYPDHECEIRLLDIPVTKAGLVAALNMHADHPDNG